MTWDWDKLQRQNNRNRRPTPPQWDEIFDKARNFKFPGSWLLGIIVLLAISASLIVFTVAVDEVGVIQRFGKYVRTAQPGLNFKWPAGIEKLTKVKVRYIYKEEFGFKTLRARSQTRFSTENQQFTALMLTGDLNVALVPWIVQFKVKDPYNYLFKVHDPLRLLRDLSESTMRLVVGDRSINEVISKREEIADQAKLLLQRELDDAETGIGIVTVEMKKTNVPEPVQPSFNEVNQAIQEKEKLIYQAKENYNKEIPAAKGEAERTIKAAEGYALNRVNVAKGDASRFISQEKEYEKAKDVTRRRLYLETMAKIFPKLGPKYILDSEQKNFLPLLNIEGKMPVLGKEEDKEKLKKQKENKDEVQE